MKRTGEKYRKYRRSVRSVGYIKGLYPVTLREVLINNDNTVEIREIRERPRIHLRRKSAIVTSYPHTYAYICGQPFYCVEQCVTLSIVGFWSSQTVLEPTKPLPL